MCGYFQCRYILKPLIPPAWCGSMDTLSLFLLFVPTQFLCVFLSLFACMSLLTPANKDPIVISWSLIRFFLRFSLEWVEYFLNSLSQIVRLYSAIVFDLSRSFTRRFSNIVFVRLLGQFSSAFLRSAVVNCAVVPTKNKYLPA